MATKKSIQITRFEVGHFAVTREPVGQVAGGAQVAIVAIKEGTYAIAHYQVRDGAGNTAWTTEHNLALPLGRASK